MKTDYSVAEKMNNDKKVKIYNRISGITFVLAVFGLINNSNSATPEIKIEVITLSGVLFIISVVFQILVMKNRKHSSR